MTRVRFAGCHTRKDYLRAGVWLKHRAQSPRVLRIDQYGPKDFVHSFEIRDPSDIDEEVVALLKEARAVGDQEHEHQSASPRSSAPEGKSEGTIDGHPFNSSIAPMGGGTHLLGLHKAREIIGKSVGDSVKIVLEADTEERTVAVPEDFRRALARDRKAKETFEKFAYTHRKEYVQWIESAKKPETRERRIAEAVIRIAAGANFS